MREVSRGQRLDPGRRQIGYARWLLWFLGLAAVGFAALLIGATWSIATTSEHSAWATAGWLMMLWIVFLALLIGPGAWYVVRTWRQIPVLQVDAWGLVWGDNWSRDLAIEWQSIASITSRRVRSHGYSDRWLLINPQDRAIQPNMPAFQRFAAWLSRAMYGTPYLIALGTLRISSDELIGLIQQHFDGQMDLTAIQRDRPHDA